jgi:hypothetical protein
MTHDVHMHKLRRLPHATTRVYHGAQGVSNGVWQFPNNTVKQLRLLLMVDSVNAIVKHTNLFGQVYVNCLDARTNVNKTSQEQFGRHFTLHTRYSFQ